MNEHDSADGQPAPTTNPPIAQPERSTIDVASSAPSAPAALDHAALVPSSGVILAQLAVVVCLAVLPLLASSIISLSGAGGGSRAQPALAPRLLHHIASSLQMTVPLIYIMWRSGEPAAAFGLCRPRAILDSVFSVIATIAIFAAWYAASFAIYSFVATRGNEDAIMRLGPSLSIGEWVVFVIAMATNAFSEEFAMRGFLLTRLQRLGFSGIVAALISAILFGAYHMYQGLAPTGIIAFEGFVLGLLFVMTKRLWPLVVAHFVMDVVAFTARM